jgi:hypothetical protein
MSDTRELLARAPSQHDRRRPARSGCRPPPQLRGWICALNSGNFPFVRSRVCGPGSSSPHPHQATEPRAVSSFGAKGLIDAQPSTRAQGIEARRNRNSAKKKLRRGGGWNQSLLVYIPVFSFFDRALLCGFRSLPFDRGFLARATLGLNSLVRPCARRSGAIGQSLGRAARRVHPPRWQRA